MTTKLAGDLSYGLPHETFYAEKGEPRAVNATYRESDGSGGFDLVFEEHDFRNSGTSVRLLMFSDTWKAWTAIPELFAALAQIEAKTLAEVTALLDSLGAEDYTARDFPGAQGPALKAVKVFQGRNTRDNARAAAEALMAYADSDPDVPF